MMNDYVKLNQMIENELQVHRSSVAAVKRWEEALKSFDETVSDEEVAVYLVNRKQDFLTSLTSLKEKK